MPPLLLIFFVDVLCYLDIDTMNLILSWDKYTTEPCVSLCIHARSYMCMYVHESVQVCMYSHVCFHPVSNSIPPSPLPVGCLQQSVSSLSSPLCAGNTTLEENEMQCRQWALQCLLLVPASDLIFYLLSCSFLNRYLLTCTQADWTSRSKYSFLGHK